MTEEKMGQDRLSVIMRVFSGVLTATQGAQLLGVSRKTYYEWQTRAIRAMVDALQDRPAGRPKVEIDAEKEELQEKVEDLNNQLFLAQKTIEVKNILADYVQRQKSQQNDSSTRPNKKKVHHGKS